jgi:hypothetical protein
MIEIKLYKSPWKSVRIILLSLPFVIISLYLIIHNDADKTMEWFCLCFFGLGIPIGIFNMLDKRPQIIINEIGIFNKAAYNNFINWNLIKDAYIKEVHRQKFICLVLDEKAIPLIKVKKKLTQINLALGFQETNISLGQIKIDDQKFLEFIKAMSTADAASKQNLLLNTQL